MIKLFQFEFKPTIAKNVTARPYLPARVTWDLKYVSTNITNIV